MRTSGPLLLAVALVLGAPPLAATADAAWSPPQRLAAAHSRGTPRTDIAADGSAVVLDVGERAGVRVASAAPGRPFGTLRTVARRPLSEAAIAAGPRGAVLVTWLGRDGALRTATRRSAADSFVVRRVGAVTGKEISSLTARWDPRGGWVVAVSAFRSSSAGWRLVGLSLDRAGAVVGAPQRLGSASFGSTARPTAALAVTPGGRAVLVADATEAPDAAVERQSVLAWTREHGGAFSGPTVVGEGAAGSARGAVDGRISVADDGRTAVAYTSDPGCGDVGCKGPPRAVTFDADGRAGSPFGPSLAQPGRAFGPSAVPTRSGTLVAWNERDRVDAFSPTAPVRVATLRPDGGATASRTLDASRLASEPIALPLAGGRALVVWAGARRIRSAVAGPGTTVRRVAGPSGPIPERFHFNDTNRDVRTAGRYAVMTWSGADERIRVARGRF